ncbi:MAG: sigma-70 family RNA polymerase sigma factor [Planctomycetota bacterium]
MKEITGDVLAKRLDDARPGVWLFVRSLGASPAEADDLVHEVFLRILDGRAKPRSLDGLSAYLRAAAKNHFVSERRQQSRRREILETDAAEAVWTRLVPDDNPESLFAALRECVGKLDGRASQAVDLFYRQGQPQHQIAKTLDLSTSNVSTILQRARGLIRVCLERSL